MVQNVKEYMEKKLVDVSKEGIKFDEDEIKKQTEENKGLIDFIKEQLETESNRSKSFRSFSIYTMCINNS